MEYLIYLFPLEDSASPYWSIVTSIASTIIAICALALTVYQTKSSDKHNRLMVTPHISSTTHIDKNTHTLSLHLENNGIGPAIIQEFSIVVDGKQVKSQDEVEAAIVLLVKNLPIDEWGHESIERKSFLSAGAKIELVTLVCTKVPLEALMQSIDPRINVTIEYTSIYGERFTYES